MNTAADQPIRKPEDDVLGRTGFARSFAEQVLQIDASEGVVVGVLGPWGSGKTSFVNLARLHWKDAGVKVLDFNPWMFSGAEQLVDRFFIELSAQMKLRPGLADIGEVLGEYGDAVSGLGWLPLVGQAIEVSRVVAEGSAKILRSRSEGTGGRREKVAKALARLGKPIVVVLDDIDRLTNLEIQDIFKLVRLTANFPNIIYVVVFDRERVEEALDEQKFPGRDYLEKILLTSSDLPAVPAQVLSNQVTGAIETALSNISNPGPFDESVWTDIFVGIIRPLIRNMRDVRRYAIAIRGTVQDLSGQVALVDVLALEAIRVFLPDVFRRMYEAVERFVMTSDGPAGLPGHVGRLSEAAGDHAEVVRALVQLLFPGGIGGLRTKDGSSSANRWLRERRVAHENILRLYLERVAGEGLQAFTEAEQAWALMADREALDAYLRSLDAERLQDVISSLEAYEDQFSREHVVPGTVVLLNLLPELPKRPQGRMFGLDSWIIVSRVVGRLVRSLKDQGEVEVAIQEVLPQVTTLSSELELIYTGRKLISESAVRAFKKGWRDRVRSTPAEALAKEPRLFWLLFRYKQEADPTEPLFKIPDSPDVTLALLKSARSEVQSLSMGSSFVHRSPRLDWDGLIELYGDESTLRERIEALKVSQPEDSDELLQLADRYLGGWRPRGVDED